MNDTASSPSSQSTEGSSDPDDPGSSTGAHSHDHPTCEIAIVQDGEHVSDDDITWLTDKLQQAAEQIHHPVERLCVSIMDEASMIQLHREQCGEDSVTDVLTFPAAQAPEPIDADIAVCFGEAQRQAERRNHSARDELLLYAVHGLLHCAGYQDHEREDFDIMHREEDRILSAIGVGSVFEDDSSGCDDNRQLPSRTPDSSV